MLVISGNAVMLMIIRLSVEFKLACYDIEGELPGFNNGL